MKPGRMARLAVLALLAWLGLAGCRALPPAPPPAALSAEEVLARLHNRQQALESLQARGRITFLSPERNYSGTILIKARRPESLRVDHPGSPGTHPLGLCHRRQPGPGVVPP